MLRVIGAIRTCFLQSAFRSSCVKILANPTRIGCVFALADQKSDLQKIFDLKTEDFYWILCVEDADRLTPFKDETRKRLKKIRF